jgi:hypothetical protein
LVAVLAGVPGVCWWLCLQECRVYVGGCACRSAGCMLVAVLAGVPGVCWWLCLQECRLPVLAECLAVGVERSLEAYQQYQDASPSPSHSPSRNRPLDPLFKAAQITLFRHINSIINTLPVPHQVSGLTNCSYTRLPLLPCYTATTQLVIYVGVK